MTPSLRFCFALHLHQPVGNFDSVFQQHLEDVYRPLFRTLLDGDLWPVTLHVSGPLLEWIDTHDPGFLDLIATQVAAGRVELLAAGHDEPILAVLSQQDRIEQIGYHRDWMRRRLGGEARGLWLTERVWEPDLAGDLARAGIDFVLVDDRHFRVSGFQSDLLHAHFQTEFGGQRIQVFPIDETLRYLVPFRPAHELAAYFRKLRAEGHGLAILGDDGEKFGGWPGTRKWLYDEGWFASFVQTMRSLRDAGEVELSRFDDALRATPSAGLAYLPSASYREMEGWSLPVGPARAFLTLEQRWKGARMQSVEGGLLRGSHWRNFLVKYPESNRMHKLMQALSEMCHAEGNPPAARRAIGRAQCNDAYWHGVFGGLYLAFLRGSVWHQLAIAEAELRRLQSPAIESRDIDADGDDEWWYHDRAASILCAPARGGTIEWWQDLVGLRNLLNIVARHPEAYHRPLETPSESPTDATNSDGAPSIHDIETELSEAPPTDLEPRGLFVDRIISAGTTLDDFVDGKISALESWALQPMQGDAQLNADGVVFRLVGKGLEKTVAYHRESGGMTCRWNWQPSDWPGDSWFASELSYSETPDIVAAGAQRWDYEIFTVAKSEKGFDRTLQGNATVLRWPMSAGSAEVAISFAPKQQVDGHPHDNSV